MGSGRIDLSGLEENFLGEDAIEILDSFTRIG